MDSLYELNTETPKLRISREEPPKPDLIFGLLAVPGSPSKESKVFGMIGQEEEDRSANPALANGAHADKDGGEVETLNIWRGGQSPAHKSHDGHGHTHHEHPEDESTLPDEVNLSKDTLDELLSKLPSEDVWRVKGFLKLAEDGTSQYKILNWAFGRYELHQASETMSKKLEEDGVAVRLTIMGARGEVRRRAMKLAEGLGARLS